MFFSVLTFSHQNANCQEEKIKSYSKVKETKKRFSDWPFKEKENQLSELKDDNVPPPALTPPTLLFLSLERKAAV